MIKTDHQLRDPHAKRHPLVIPPGFSQGVTGIIAFQVDFPAPPLHKLAERGDGQRLAPPFALEQKIIVDVGSRIEQVLNRSDTSAI